MTKTLRNSIFKNVAVLIHGSIVLLNSNSTKLTFKELTNINPLIGFLGFRLNNKIYSKRQLKNLKKISYIDNIFKVYNNMKIFTKIPYYKLKKNRTLPISK